MDGAIGLPEGFELDQSSSALPEGFQLDDQQASAQDVAQQPNMMQQAPIPQSNQIAPPIDLKGAIQERLKARTETPAQEDISSAGQFILDVPGGAALTEFTSAVNRGAVNLLDFVGPDQINNVLQLMGSKSRVPTLSEQPTVQAATTGEFMEPGLARTAVRTAGEFVAPGAVVGQTIRTAAQQIPKVAAQAPTVTQRVVQSMASKPLPDAVATATAGAGSEIGAEAGEAIGGEKGEQIGRIVGGFGAPLGATAAKEVGKKLISTSAKKLLTESAPTIQGLKKAAKAVYDDLENSGVNITSGGIRKMAGSLSELAAKQGFHQKIHPKVAVALNEFKAAAELGRPLKLSEVDNLRRIAGAAAKSLEPDEARLGVLLTTRIDDLLDNVSGSMLSKTGKDIGAKYKDARQLWRRVKKSEQLAEVFDKAQLQASGFENGIRTQFRSILNSKSKRKGFTSDEVAAMREVVQGTSLSNTAKMLGKFGFGEGQASNMLMGYAGIAGGAAVGGPVGAVVVPSIGQLSRKLAQRLTREGGKNADLMVKAGKNGLDIVKLYMKITPPKDRSAKEITELLLRPDISLQNLKNIAKRMPIDQKKLVNDAAFLVNAIKSAPQEDKQQEVKQK